MGKRQDQTGQGQGGIRFLSLFLDPGGSMVSADMAHQSQASQASEAENPVEG